MSKSYVIFQQKLSAHTNCESTKKKRQSFHDANRGATVTMVHAATATDHGKTLYYSILANNNNHSRTIPIVCILCRWPAGGVHETCSRVGQGQD